MTLVQELGQPVLDQDQPREDASLANVDDVNNLIETAIGTAATQVVQGEKEFDSVVRLDREYRDNPEEIGNIP